MNKVYVGDAGTVVVLDCGQNVEGAVTRAIEVRRPDGSFTSWPATPNGTNAIQATINANELTIAGAWRLQASVVMPNGTWRGATTVLRVYPRMQ
jgi:hypothetical protein